MIRVRFAPSPTGYLHLGGLRTALYDYLFARHHKGKAILRIEDTDRSRFVPGAIENLISALHVLGVDFDEGPGIGGDHGPYIQSERLDLYHREVRRLLDTGHAYHCFCASDTLEQMRKGQQERGEFVKYDRRCLSLSSQEVSRRIESGESYVIRIKMPDGRRIVFDDLVRGRVEMDSSQSDDQVLLKSDGFPTYHLAAVVDDHYMDISHVIRGEEWLSSTPKHVWLYECLGWETPLWVHLPLLLNPDRSKLSKRMNDVSVESYLRRGYLKEALLNFVALLGWHSADDREFFTIEELINEFSLERVNKAGAVFDTAKLDWMNGHYMRELPLDLIVDRVMPFFVEAGIPVPENETMRKIVATARDRCTLLPEIVDYSKMFLMDNDLSDADREILMSPESQTVLKWWEKSLAACFPLNAEKIDTLIKAGIQETQMKGKAFYTPLRLALIAQSHGPDLPSIFSILGYDTALQRIRRSIIN
jgi:glutamyl-tRNA synthetase